MDSLSDEPCHAAAGLGRLSAAMASQPGGRPVDDPGDRPGGQLSSSAGPLAAAGRGRVFPPRLFLASPGAAAPGGRIGGLLLSGGGRADLVYRRVLPVHRRAARADYQGALQLAAAGLPAAAPDGGGVVPAGYRRWPLSAHGRRGQRLPVPTSLPAAGALSNRGAEGRPGGAGRVYPAALSGTPGQLGGGPRLSGDVRRYGRLRHGR